MAFKETYNIDSAQAERALKNIAEAQKRIEESADKATQKLSAEDKAARRIAEAADPMKKFNRQHEELAVLVNKGKVSLEDATIVAGKYQQRLDQVGKTGEGAFGQRAVGQLASYATGIVSVGAVIGGVKAIFSTMRQEADAAAERIKASLDALGELQQLEGFSDNRAFVDELRKQGVVKDASQGAKFAFALDSAGFGEKDQEFIAYELVKSRFIAADQAASVATAAGKAGDLLGIDSLKDTFQKLTQASGGTAANIPSLALATTKFGGQFKAAGFNADEALAALEVADKNSASVDAAAERLKSFANQVNKKGLSKGSFLETVNSLREQEKAGKNIFDLLGEANAVAGYQLFDEASEQSNFNASRDRIATASERDVLGGRLGGIYADPMLSAAINAQAAKGALEVEQEARNGELQLLFQELRDTNQQYVLSRYGRFSAAAEDAQFGLASTLFLERATLQKNLNKEINEGNRGDGGRFSKDFEDRMLDYLERTANNTDPQQKPSAE